MSYELDFEKPLADLENKIHALQKKDGRLSAADGEKLGRLQRELQQKTLDIYSQLTPWQRVKVARHPRRPYTLDYIPYLLDEFVELHGDRRFGDDRSIIAGIGRMEKRTVMLIGHQKGRDLKSNQEHNHGMAHPEGYRKALRLFKQAEKFGFSVITLIDTPGASPGLGDEERGQAEAIAENIQALSRLQVPVVAVITGEGGSGGALALGLADRVLMLEYAIYTVVSPEGCAAILWRDTAFAAQAAEAMKITAPELQALQLIDGIVPEPPGGAHSDPPAAARRLKEALEQALAELTTKNISDLLAQRYAKFRAIGHYTLV